MTRSRRIPGTTGQRVAVKLYRPGTSVLGVPFDVIVVGTPDNIANLDAGRNDAAFWRGVIEGTTSQAAALSQVGVRPAFGWITGTPHGNEPAGGEASVKELYDLTARTDCANVAATRQPRRVHPAGHRTRRPRPQRPHDGVELRPQPRPRDDPDAGEPGCCSTTPFSTQGLFFIDAHQQSSGYFFPPNEDAALHEISHFALDLINDMIGPSIQRRSTTSRRSTATTTPTTCSSPSTATPCRPC